MKKIEEICRAQYSEFDEKYLVYSHLRKKGYIVTPGIKFGCDFAVYEQGPGIDHAPYLVDVLKPGDKLTALGIVLTGRLATTVKKQFIIAISDTAKENVDFISFDWWRAWHIDLSVSSFFLLSINDKYITFLRMQITDKLIEKLGP